MGIVAVPAGVGGRRPTLCAGCSHRSSFYAIKKAAPKGIYPSDIGCYTLGLNLGGVDTVLCMGAAISNASGIVRVLAPEEQRRVVGVIGDSTFVHSGISGLVEMVYNPPKTGHGLIILDNGITAMTGMQENPSTGRLLDHSQTGKFSLEGFAKAAGVKNVDVIDPVKDPKGFEALLVDRLSKPELTVIISRRPCIIAAPDIRAWDQAIAAGCGAAAKEA